MDNALGMLGLALRAGRLAVGEEACADACAVHGVRLLLLAQDAGEHVQRRAAFGAEEGNCLLVETPWSKAEMGGALGRGSCAVAAVTDVGMARALAEKLAAADPEKYGATAERLAVKAKRAAERKQKRK